MVELIKQQLQELYDLRFNTVKQAVEYRIKGTNRYTLISGKREWYTILSKVQERIPSCSFSQLEAVIYGRLSADSDPFLEYFDSLPAWDGKDYIGELCSTVETDDYAFWRILLRKFLLGVVKGMLEPEHVNHYVLVLVGGQGIGKSSWLSRLAPESLKLYYHSGPIDPKNKDDVRKLAECMLINLDELDAMGRHNAARLKELITRGTINLRKPYGADNEILTRRTSFSASLNSSQFLHDQSGNRRFWCVNVSAIHREVLVDIDLVYAQLYHEVKAGASPELTQEEAAKVDLRNANHLHMSPIEEAIHAIFEGADEADGQFYRATEVAQEIKSYLGVKHVNHSFITKVGTALSKKFPVRRPVNDRGYYLRKRGIPSTNQVNTSLYASRAGSVDHVNLVNQI